MSGITLEACPFCGWHKPRLRYRQSCFLEENDYGAKEIRFTGSMVCTRCLSRGAPVFVVVNDVNTVGWVGRLENKMLPLAAAAWNRRPGDAEKDKTALLQSSL